MQECDSVVYISMYLLQSHLQNLGWDTRKSNLNKCCFTVEPDFEATYFARENTQTGILGQNYSIGFINCPICSYGPTWTNQVNPGDHRTKFTTFLGLSSPSRWVLLSKALDCTSGVPPKSLVPKPSLRDCTVPPPGHRDFWAFTITILMDHPCDWSKQWKTEVLVDRWSTKTAPGSLFLGRKPSYRWTHGASASSLLGPGGASRTSELRHDTRASVSRASMHYY